MRYFAYGSNMSRARLEGRLGRVVDLGRARCADRRHRFSKLGLDGTGKGNIERAAEKTPNGGHHVRWQSTSPKSERSERTRTKPVAGGNIELVWGVLYELDAGQLERLVEIEAGYRLIEVEVELEVIGPVRTATFEALEQRPGLAPTREYVEHYVTGIREHGIPDAYLAALLGEFHWLVG